MHVLQLLDSFIRGLDVARFFLNALRCETHETRIFEHRTHGFAGPVTCNTPFVASRLSSAHLKTVFCSCVFRPAPEWSLPSRLGVSSSSGSFSFLMRLFAAPLSRKWTPEHLSAPEKLIRASYRSE